MDGRVYLLIIGIIVSCVALVSCADSEDNAYINAERRLYEHLLSSTNPDLRPVKKPSDQLGVKFGLGFINLLNVDEKAGIVTTQVWLRMLWNNVDLRWDPAEYDNVTTLRMPAKKIWQPDIVLYNAAQEGTVQFLETQTVVYNSGDVLWIPPVIMKSQCSFDMTNFPFDSQICILKFGSWTYDGYLIDIDFYEGQEGMDLSDYIQNNEWEVTDTSARKNVKFYPCCAEPYPDLTFTFKMERQSSYHSLMYVAPIVLIAILSPFLFLLPYRETQRFSLGGCLLICLAILIGNFEWIYASTPNSTPMLGRYYCSIIVLLTLSLTFSATIVNLADRSFGFTAPPRFLKIVFVDGLGRIFCVSTADYNAIVEAESAKGPESGTEKKSSRQAGNAEWRAIAQVLDRLFFIVYVVLTIILSLVYLA